MALHRKNGDMGALAIASDLLKKRYKVLFPFGEDWRFDLVLWKNGKFYKIQCKYDGVNKDHVGVSCRSIARKYCQKYTETDIDYIAVYHKFTDKCYYIPSKYFGESGRNCMNLRLKYPKNNIWTHRAKNFLKI